MYKETATDAKGEPAVASTALLASLETMIEAWRRERDFLATGSRGDKTAARIYDECARELFEVLKVNTGA